MTTNIQSIQEEVTRELANKDTLNMLVATTFKGLTEENVRLAVTEGMLRNFTFKDFLERNVYAVPFKDNNTGKQAYSLITSVDYARKIGLRSGVIGKSVPVFVVDKEGRIISCSVTIKRKINNDVGEFSSLVFFDEYTTGKNLWTSKPRTMIAKVAEMHALRMACPEEMSQVYVEEELEKTIIDVTPVQVDIKALEAKLTASKSLEELKTNWSALPAEAKTKLTALKDELKKVLL
jgi:hypothetical protein